MSNLPPNSYNNIAEGPQINANVGPPMFNHHQQFSQVPASQLPPGYAPGLKQDSNSNSPLHVPTSVPQNHTLQNITNYNQSGSSSPAFNQSGILPPMHSGSQSSLIKPVSSLPPNKNPLPPSASQSSASPRTVLSSNSSPTPYAPNYQPQHQINDNAPPLISSSQFSQPLNGPPISSPPRPIIPSSQYTTTSSSFISSSMDIKPPNAVSSFNSPPMTQAFGPPPLAKLPGPNPIVNQPSVQFSSSLAGQQQSSPIKHTTQGPPTNGPMSGQTSTQPASLPYSMGMNGPSMAGPPLSGPPLGPPISSSGLNPKSGSPSKQIPGPAGLQNTVPTGMLRSGPIGPQMGGQTQPFPPQTFQMGNPAQSRPTSGLPQAYQVGGPPHFSQLPSSFPSQPLQIGGPNQLSQMAGPTQPFPGPPQNGPSFPPISAPGPSMGPPSGPLSLPTQFVPTAHQIGPSSGPSNIAMKSNMQNRYPQMPPSNLGSHQPPLQPNMSQQYPQQMQQYNSEAMTQQMGQLSVTKQGFDQLWGHHMVDLLQHRQILPEYPEDPPEIKLGGQFADASNCSPEIFRCTLNKIPETNSLLQKSRLPLGILIHPFKDLNHLPVIQCNTIVRCRACRTYINPFVYFVDAKRWKCNLCYRVNDLPEEFQYDPVSKSYGDPSRRPEIKSATIEFIAPGEYMLRPPQPAVYLFLMDVSQIARDSGYLQVVCDTLKANLDQLPGDARTQVGFVCFDSHVHYYNMSDGLTRPKEMTVLDIDDVFLPSPESLLVNLAERRELIRELLTVLPNRHCGPGVPGSALGAALQAAYRLMAPTGGRITVFQTCLPNTGPGALQSREDPNARSSKEVLHLNPATDFYKRLALDCSGAQVAVDLFLLNSQYSDLATLSGMSKFSGGTVYHIPLFKASRTWQAEQLNKMFSRYLTRKIGFEAVMRVRCTRGISVHTFHGNFFVRSTDLLSLPNVSPDVGFGMLLAIDESLADLQQVCFQAALLYTSSKGERRIRVHTMALPIASTLPDVLHAADQHCIIGLLSKMAVDRAMSASMTEAREAVMNVAVDALSAHRLAQNLPAGTLSAALHAPLSMRLLPLLLLALLKRRAFRSGTSTRLDDRVADMCVLKCAPLALLLRGVYPHLYPIHALSEHLVRGEEDEELVPDPPRLHLTAERINSTGAYLLDDGESMIIYIGHNVSPAYLSETFGVAAFTQLADESRVLPKLETDGNHLLHVLIERLNDDRPYSADILILRDNSPTRQQFTERLIDDRVESAFSYYEFLQHVKTQVK